MGNLKGKASKQEDFVGIVGIVRPVELLGPALALTVALLGMIIFVYCHHLLGR